jgi:hypothetical protein
MPSEATCATPKTRQVSYIPQKKHQYKINKKDNQEQ